MAWGKKKKRASRKQPMLDYKELEWALLEMETDWRLFKMIKAEMINRGHWKAKARGKPFESGFDPRRGARL